MTESDIEKYLIKQVKALGGIAYKFTSPQRRSVPDRIVLLPEYLSRGEVFFIELKAPGKKPTEAQAREHTRIQDLGYSVLVIDTKDGVDEFICELRED